MKTRIQLLFLPAVAGLVLLACLDAGAAERFTVFGLEHSLLTNTLRNTTTVSPLRVENESRVCPTDDCVIQDGFGLTVHLGEAESGLFAYPDDADAVLEVDTEFSGYLLTGYAYGSVDGVTNRPISSLSATRAGWGQYVMKPDFSSIGATSYTYELFSAGIRTLYVTNQEPWFGLSTYDIEPGVPPRANPFWRLPDGVGAVIELPGVTRFYTYNGASGVGERFVIRAEGATSRVDYVSHVDIVGSDGLPRFAIEDERIGMFGLSHRVLGSVTFSAKKQELTLVNSSPTAGQGTEGVMIEAPQGLRWEGAFRELSLSNDNTSILLSAAGMSSTNRDGAFYGPVGVSRMAGAGRLVADFSGLCATGVVVEASLHGVSAGSLVVSGTGTMGTLAVTNPVVLRCSASARDGTVGASFSFALADVTTFTATNGLELIGDEFHLSPAAPGEVVGTLKHVVLQGVGVERVTLTNEAVQVASLPVLALDIERAGAGVILSWPTTPNIVAVGRTELTAGDWGASGLTGFHYADFRTYATLARFTNEVRYYQLEHYYNHYIHPGNPE